MIKEQGCQILKTRDDNVPVCIQRDATPSDPGKPFRLSAKAECSWAKGSEPFGSETLRPRIEPWLTALVQSEHLSLLIGSGLTHAIHGIATGNALSGMDSITFGVFDDEISAESKRVAESAGRQNGNFEDQIRVASELLRGLEIMPPKETDSTLGSARVSSLTRSP